MFEMQVRCVWVILNNQVTVIISQQMFLFQVLTNQTQIVSWVDYLVLYKMEKVDPLKRKENLTNTSFRRASVSR